MHGSANPQPETVKKADLERLAAELEPRVLERIKDAARTWAEVKQRGGKVVVATGSGPNIHEGVTTLIAALIQSGMVDGVLTSSAVAGHEMAGALERVKRVEGARLGLPLEMMPSDGRVEAALISRERLAQIAADVEVDLEYYRRLVSAPGKEIIKVAGNLAYPTGPWLEDAALGYLPAAKKQGRSLEAVAGEGCHPLTMLGAAARKKAPCLVTVPQLVGGGAVGLAIGDSITISRRSELVAQTLDSADLIIESGLALAQEIHDGPFELFTGHGLWARKRGEPTFSLRDKKVVRIDLDPHIERIWNMQRQKEAVSQAIHTGKPKAVGLGLPFRMEFSGFARIPGSLPITADLGMVWPLMAGRAAHHLGADPAFMCYKQGTGLGESLREFIVQHVTPMKFSNDMTGR